MTAGTLALVLFSVSLSAAAQIAFKAGVTAARAEPAGEGVMRFISMFLQPGVIGGLALYGIGTIVWLVVLGRTQVSQAYPFVGLGFVLTAILGATLFGDTLTTGRIAGIALVILGIILIARD